MRIVKIIRRRISVVMFGNDQYLLAGPILSRTSRPDNMTPVVYNEAIMAAQIIDGKQIAQEVQEELSQRISRLTAGGNQPGLAVVLVGENPASISYVTAKERDCEKVGIRSFDHRLPVETSQEDLVDLVDSLNRDPAVHGILVQLPLPDHIDSDLILQRISPDKDVDGFHPLSLGKMLTGLPTLLPCTPHGVVQMLMRSGNDPAGKHVVILGRSNIVGKPLANLLALKKPGGNATVTICHSRTADIGAITRQADILVAAIGVAEFVKADMVRDGAVVIDVGVNRVDDPSKKKGYRLVGDVHFDGVSAKAAAITPVPGGVGPMTRTMLLFNTVIAAESVHGS
jgi:methylenetetrahydrofolate dehydrogenase (NADP+) / methenyltetrahydrofolate cyclohydrolase